MSPVKRKRKSRSPATRSWRRRVAANALKPCRAKLGHQYPAWAQSLELLKIAVHVTVAFILFMRELLPGEAFCDRSLGKVNVGQIYTYEDFLTGYQETPLEGRAASAHAKKLKAAAKAKKSDGFKNPWVKMIQRGTDEVANQIRDCMQEIGNGLARRRLDTLTLCVRAGFDAHDGSLPLFETYAMRFVYGGKRGFADKLDGIIDPILRPRSLNDIRKHIYNVSRKLTMLKNAPAPLSGRQLGIVMTYNKASEIRTAEFEFSSPSTNSDRSGNRASELDQNWDELTEVGGLFDTGYHVSAHHLF
ncbi:hypothetical protein N7448_004605 [Penicillium atrosanguineum]|uniref:HORMA domain-containing protein n=1 Tax=Penicillium atrosanguineum TaxID=1132637 RepID=A0A9W9PQ12_9EURO|nr:uncharacterized protein N7443_008353 [Penicillium atrosanguineum]KAJ5125277.1 hypothetical protein N7526_007454 [Penicillium atrosanguineum]KAJ5136051.1 hypothetical protein N7448_004605 [Penicillium atrosanguineum]KAJ5292400.1 hypothetical protein N7443_008353 [Penicillium atrosanguineum]KAJ5303576.1 hypothetical protein N7476_010375 [Penicillium atrosanguineum]